MNWESSDSTKSQHRLATTGWIRAARDLTTKFPDATFIPGHGPIATAKDLLHHAA